VVKEQGVVELVEKPSWGGLGGKIHHPENLHWGAGATKKKKTKFGGGVGTLARKIQLKPICRSSLEKREEVLIKLKIPPKTIKKTTGGDKK